MHSAFNPFGAVAAAAAARPDHPALKTQTLSVSYAQLRDLVVSFAHHLRDRGVDRSSFVAIRPPDVVAAVAAIYATALLGCRWTKATKAAVKSREALGITHLLVGRTEGGDGDAGIVAITPDWQRPPDGRDASDLSGFEGFASPDDIWAVAQSSGTTGSPKFMQVTLAHQEWRLIFYSGLDEQFRLGFPAEFVSVSLFPPLAPVFVSACLVTFAKGGTLLYGADYSFLAANGAAFVAGSPGHVAELIRNVPPPARPLIPALVVGGGASSADFLAGLRRYFGSVLNAYGSTEAGWYCARLVLPGEFERVSVGFPMTDAQVQIVGEDDEPLADGAEGIVRIRTAGMVSGYLNAPAASGSVFRDGWFYPGDLGMWMAGEGLAITGRVTDSLNVRGVKLNAAAIDSMLQSVQGVEEALCFVEPAADGLNALSILAKPVQNADPSAVAEAIRGESRLGLHRWRVPTRVYFTGELPRNANGKTLRREAFKMTRGLTPVEIAATR